MRCIVTMVIYLHKSYQTKMSLNVNNLKDFIECFHNFNGDNV